MGWMQCSSAPTLAAKAEHLEKLGVPAELSLDLATWIDQTGGLLAECLDGAPHARALVNSLHDKAWFKLDGDDKYIQTLAGGRQGCILGPVVFNMIYSIALRRTRTRLSDRGLLVEPKPRDSEPFWASAGTDWCLDVGGKDEDKIFEIAFVDDVAAMLAAVSADALMAALPIMVEELCFILHSLGFVVNWKEGKTEAMVSLRGKRSQELRQEIYEAGGNVQLDPSCGCASLRIVSNYKHLGCKFGADCKAGPDTEHRVSTAMSSYCPLSQKVFAATEISRQVRMRLFFSLVVSRLTYCVHTWSSLSRPAYKRLNSVYMRGLRRIAGKSRFNKESAKLATDKEVRQELGAMSLQCLLVRRRLLLLSQVVRFGSSHMQALFATKRNDGSRLPWAEQVLCDMSLLFKNCNGKLDELGPPEQYPEAWFNLMCTFPAQWAQIVRKLFLASMPFDEIQKAERIRRHAWI